MLDARDRLSPRMYIADRSQAEGASGCLFSAPSFRRHGRRASRSRIRPRTTRTRASVRGQDYHNEPALMGLKPWADTALQSSRWGTNTSQTGTCAWRHTIMLSQSGRQDVLVRRGFAPTQRLWGRIPGSDGASPCPSRGCASSPAQTELRPTVTGKPDSP